MSNHPPNPKPTAAKAAADALEESEVSGVDTTVLFGLPWLTTSRVARLVKFGLVGVSGVAVNLVVFEFFFRFGLVELGLVGGSGMDLAALEFSFRFDEIRFAVANALGIVVSIFTNFLLNDAWTWGDRIKGNRRDWFARLGKYYLSAAAAGVVQLLVAWATKTLVFARLSLELSAESWLMPQWVAAKVGTIDVGPSLAVLTGIAFGMAINLLASHLWAFRDAEVE